MADAVSAQDLSSEQIKEDIELLHSYSVWKRLDSQLRKQGNLPIETEVAGRQVTNMNRYRTITQGYGDELAILSIIIHGKPLGSAVFPKFQRQESDDLSDVNDFWRKLLNALLDSKQCLPICSMKAFSCATNVSWNQPWFLVARDLICCVVSQVECRDCLVEAFKKAFFG